MSSRDKSQLNLVYKWSRELGGLGWISACTGYGKTRVALLIIGKLLEKNPLSTIHVVVPTTYLKEQWDNRCKYPNVEVFVVNTYVKEPRQCTLIVADEAHRFTTNTAEYFNKVLSMSSTYKLALSATFNKEQESFMKQIGLNQVGNITLEEAVENNWVSGYKHYNLLLDMTELDQFRYKQLNDKFNKHFGYFAHDWDLAKNCLQKDFRKKYVSSANINTTSLNKVTDEEVIIQATQFMRAVKERKSYLYKAQAKVEAVVDIFNRLPKERRIISFCESTEFADSIVDQIGHDKAVSYHSNLDTIEVEENIYKDYKTEKGALNKADKEGGTYYQIKNGTFRVKWSKTVKKGKKTRKEYNIRRLLDERYNIRLVSTAKALDEGADMPVLDTGIIASGTKNKLRQIQRIGRVIRKKPNKEAIILNIALRNTQDVKWLHSRTKGLKVDETFQSVNEFIEHVRKPS